MKPQIYKRKRRATGSFVAVIRRYCVLAFLVAACCSDGLGQSTDQSYPTPITSNQINGTIKARDLGDSRLTSYFYIFNGSQGDVFINVVTSNLNGDIDVFNASNMNPLTKIVVFADSSNNETGRVIYLRKSEKLILRIQGRTPNDDPATYTIKFAGSFQPFLNISEIEQPPAPVVKNETESDVIVNSVGTIIGVKPKPTPAPTSVENTAENEEEQKESAAKADSENTSVQTAENVKETGTKEAPDKKIEVVVTENNLSQEKTVAENETITTIKKIENKKAPEKTNSPAKPKSKTSKSEKTAVPNPLENVRLIVLFKDGSKIERPMSQISRVNVDNKGVLTIVSKDGSIGRYSILDVAKMTIE